MLFPIRTSLWCYCCYLAFSATNCLDPVANDPFPAEARRSARQTCAYDAETRRRISRAIKGSRTNVIANSELRYLPQISKQTVCFDAAGNLSIAQELGNILRQLGYWYSLNPRDIVKDTSTNNIFLVNTAHTSSVLSLLLQMQKAQSMI